MVTVEIGLHIVQFFVSVTNPKDACHLYISKLHNLVGEVQSLASSLQGNRICYLEGIVHIYGNKPKI